MSAYKDDDVDREIESGLLSRAYRSMSVMEQAFIYNGSGRYLPLRTAEPGSKNDVKAALAKASVAAEEETGD